MNHKITRRHFLHASGMAVLGTGLAACGGTSSVSDEQPNPNQGSNGDGYGGGQRKTLVCIMLDGGNDSFNMLVPHSESAYQQYRDTRGPLALEKSQLLPLNNFSDRQGKNYGLHPSLSNMQQLFSDNQLSFVANIGPLIQPITKTEFAAGSVPVPLGLMSHYDQFSHWQTARPHERVNTGWFGRLADTMQPNLAADKISMNLSLAGSNVMQNGASSREYAIKKDGSVGLKARDESNPVTKGLNALLSDSFDQILAGQSGHAFQDTYSANLKNAQAQHEEFEAALDGITLSTSFLDRNGQSNKLAEQLKMAAKTIKAAPALELQQQTIFVRYIGWDHHSELLENHARMLAVLDDALKSFHDALVELGVDDQVVTFTGSDFGRTLTSNGNGSDHAWAGHALVMGNAINGGKIFGEYPQLSLADANPLDVGGGVLIPTTSTDELFAELALWLGSERNELNALFPNLHQFYDVNSEAAPLGLFASA